MLNRLIFVPALLFVLAAPAHAAAPAAQKSLGVFGDWRAYTFTENRQPVCYMIQKAQATQGRKLKRGAAYLTITHRPAEFSRDVVSYAAGYDFKPTSEVRANVGGQNFKMFTQKDMSWARDAMTDRKLTSSIRLGANIAVTGNPRAGGSVTDAFSLRGSEAAYQAITKACGYPLEKAVKPVLHKKSAVKSQSVKKKAAKAKTTTKTKAKSKAKKKTQSKKHKR